MTNEVEAFYPKLNPAIFKYNKSWALVKRGFYLSNTFLIDALGPQHEPRGGV
jgi:hypothetical protein